MNLPLVYHFLVLCILVACSKVAPQIFDGGIFLGDGTVTDGGDGTKSEEQDGTSATNKSTVGSGTSGSLDEKLAEEFSSTISDLSQSSPQTVFYGIRLENGEIIENISMEEMLYLSTPRTPITFRVVTPQGFNPRMKYLWTLPNGEKVETRVPQITRSFWSRNFQGSIRVRVVYKHQFVEAISPVVILPPLQSVSLHTNSSTLELKQSSMFSCSVIPEDMLLRSNFTWYFGTSEPVATRGNHVVHKFHSPGTHRVRVVASNWVSSVQSDVLLVNVVEKIGAVVGFTSSQTVLADLRTKFEVRYMRGTHVTHHWTFGDGERRDSVKPYVHHVYSSPGEYNLTILLTNGISNASLSTTVFVLPPDGGNCSIPVISGIYPNGIRKVGIWRKIMAPSFDSGQEIILEPLLSRSCDRGSGPIFSWTITDSHQNLVAEFQNISVLLRPFDNIHLFRRRILNVGKEEIEKSSHGFYTSLLSNYENIPGRNIPEGRMKKEEDSRDFLIPNTNISVSLGIGNYSALFEVVENGTVIHAEQNVTFAVVEVPFSVNFLGGSSKVLSTSTNITLWIEVRSSTPDYKLKLDCRNNLDTTVSCFSVPDPWSSIRWKRVPIRELILQHRHSMMYNSSSHTTQGRGNLWGLSDNIHTYIERVSVDRRVLANMSELLFSVRGRPIHTVRHNGTDEQLVKLINHPVLDIGIIQYLESFQPFGSRDRVVFEATCFSSCDSSTLNHVIYQWDMKKISTGRFLQDHSNNNKRFSRETQPLLPFSKNYRLRTGSGMAGIYDNARLASVVATDHRGKNTPRIFTELELAYQVVTGGKNYSNGYIMRFEDYRRLYRITKILLRTANDHGPRKDNPILYDKTLLELSSSLLEKKISLSRHPDEEITSHLLPSFSSIERQKQDAGIVSTLTEADYFPVDNFYPLLSHELSQNIESYSSLESLENTQVHQQQHHHHHSKAPSELSSEDFSRKERAAAGEFLSYQQTKFPDGRYGQQGYYHQSLLTTVEAEAVKIVEKMLGVPVTLELIQKAHELLSRWKKRRDVALKSGLHISNASAYTDVLVEQTPTPSPTPISPATTPSVPTNERSVESELSPPTDPSRNEGAGNPAYAFGAKGEKPKYGVFAAVGEGIAPEGPNASPYKDIQLRSYYNPETKAHPVNSPNEVESESREDRSRRDVPLGVVHRMGLGQIPLGLRDGETEEDDLVEGESTSLRYSNYFQKLRRFVLKTNQVPKYKCAPSDWHKCDGDDDIIDGDEYNELKESDEEIFIPYHEDYEAMEIMEDYHDPPPQRSQPRYSVTEVTVPYLREMTTTGLNQRKLVLYTHWLDADSAYVLRLRTGNNDTEATGESEKLLVFSTPPTIHGCQVRPLAEDNRFEGSCQLYHGDYYPTYLEWSYRHSYYGDRTIIYRGPLPRIRFSLPSGLEATDFSVYITVSAVDGKGVSRAHDPMRVSVHPLHTTGDGVVTIFVLISKMEPDIPSLELQTVRSLSWELNLIESSIISQTVFDNLLAILFYREKCQYVQDMVPNSDGHILSSDSTFYQFNMLKSCARDYLAEIACASVIRSEDEINQKLSAISSVVDSPEFISSLTFFRTVDAMLQIQAQHITLWDYRSELRNEIMYNYFSLVSTMLDKQEEMYNLDTVSVNVTSSLISSLMMVMDKEVHTRFIEEAPLEASTSTLRFKGSLFNTHSHLSFGSDSAKVEFEFEGRRLIDFGVMALVHAKSPYMMEEGAEDVSSEVVQLHVDYHNLLPFYVTVTLPRSKLLPQNSYDFRRSGNIMGGSLSVYELEVTDSLLWMPLQVSLKIKNSDNSEYPVSAILMICSDLQSLDNPLYQTVLPATKTTAEGTLFVSGTSLSTGRYVLIVMDKNSYDNRGLHHKVARKNETISNRASYVLRAWWGACRVWQGAQWGDGDCILLQSAWNEAKCRCTSKYPIFGSTQIPILPEKDTINVNELMLQKTYGVVFLTLVCVTGYVITAIVILLTNRRTPPNRCNIWIRDNRTDHQQAYLLTVVTGTQRHAGTGAKVFAIIHGTLGMSETRELQSKDTGYVFAKGTTCSFILTTEKSLGHILKVEVWHNNEGDSCIRDEPLSSDTSVTRDASVAMDTSDKSFEDDTLSYVSSTSSLRRQLENLSLGSTTTLREKYSGEEGNVLEENEGGDASKEGTTPQEGANPKEGAYPNEGADVPVKGLTMRDGEKKGSSKKSPPRSDTCCNFPQTCGHLAAWFVCEVSVADLVEDTVFDFPCYDWLSVANEDSKLHKEISLECPTTFMQDVHHFYPQLSSESFIYNSSLASASHNVAHYKLQRLSVAVIVLLGVANLALYIVSYINVSHDMITPDLHLEPLFSSLLLAIIVIPSKWILLRVFTIANRLEEQETTVLRAKETIRKLKNDACAEQTSATSQRTDESSEEELEEEWRGMSRWSDHYPALDSGDVLPQLRRRVFAGIADCDIPDDVKEKIDSLSYGVKFKPFTAETEESRDAENGCEVDDINEEFIFKRSVFPRRRLLMQVTGWLLCALSLVVTVFCLFRHGIQMPMDYFSLWLQIIYLTLCLSNIVIRPLNDLFFTVLKVFSYRRMKSTYLSLSSCMVFPLDITVAIWKSYRTALKEQDSYTQSNSKKQKLEELARSRQLRSSLPPTEETLAKCRQKELKRRQITLFLRSTFEHISLLILFLLIASNVSVMNTFESNTALKRATLNGSCFDTADEYYIKFKDIKTRAMWYEWSYSELISLVYNEDSEYSIKYLFCDTNAILVGTPRIRDYSVKPKECGVENVMISENVSFTSFLGVGECYPEYVDTVHHETNFQGDDNKKYEWDAHYLAVLRGIFSHYSYTEVEYILPDEPFASLLFLATLEATNALSFRRVTRSLITEFALYHPHLDLCTTVILMAEFPSVSGTGTIVTIQSTKLDRYQTAWEQFGMYCQVLLLPVAMIFLTRTVLLLYRSRLRVFQSIWGILDLVLSTLLWSYVICLMLRVHIAEDLIWQLKVAYYSKFVNLKSVMVWDNVIEALLALLIYTQMMRCLWLFSFFQRYRKYGLVISSAFRSLMYVTAVLMLTCIGSISFCYILFNSVSIYFHDFYSSFISVFSFVTRINSSAIDASDYPTFLKWFANLFISFSTIFIVPLTYAFYFAVISYEWRTVRVKPRTVEISPADIYNFVVDLFKFNVPFKSKLKEKCELKEETRSLAVNEIRYHITELEVNLNLMTQKLNSLLEYVDFSEVADESLGSDDLFADSLSFRPTSSIRMSKKRSYDESNCSSEIVGLTDVPSLRLEEDFGRTFVNDLVLVQATSSVNSYENNNRTPVVKCSNEEHMVKFLTDASKASIDLAGDSFSKYGKHFAKTRNRPAKRIKKSPEMFIPKFGKPESFGFNEEERKFWEMQFPIVSEEN